MLSKPELAALAERAKAERAARVFEDLDLALCAIDALVGGGHVKTSIRIPSAAPFDEEDYEDESESWRDGETNQDGPINELLALLDLNRKGLLDVNVLTSFKSGFGHFIVTDRRRGQSNRGNRRVRKHGVEFPAKAHVFVFVFAGLLKRLIGVTDD